MTRTMTGTIANGIVTLDRPVDPTVIGRVTITMTDSAMPPASRRGRSLHFGSFPELRDLDVDSAIREIREEGRRAFDRKWGSPEAGD